MTIIKRMRWLRVVLVCCMGLVLNSTGWGQDIVSDIIPSSDPTQLDPTYEDVSNPDPENNFGVTGDWLGVRDGLAKKGIQFQADVTQYYQGVTSGGLSQTFDYGGHADYVINTDLNKLGGPKGLFLKIRGETQMGQFINNDTGAILAANSEGLIPKAGEDVTALTNLLITQFLSETAAVFVGKLDTYDGDLNEFASGRGKTQFMNVGFVVNPIAFRTVPYSTYGAGFFLLDGQTPWLTVMVIDAVDRSTQGPSDMFSEGVTISGEMRRKFNFFGRPGHQLIGGTWSNRNLPDLNRLLVPAGQVIPTASSSWSLYYNFDQFLVADDNGKGWGVFGRAAIADEATNPLGWFVSAGIGGHSFLPRRSNDTFGVGWFYASTSDSLTGPLLGDNGQAVELFYNIHLTRWLHLTPDFQIVNPSRTGVDTSIICGLRAKIDL